MTNNSLESLAKNVEALEESGHPPVHLWAPDHCGAIDIVIQHCGSWLHDGGEIKRESLVKLFASVLWFENGQHYLKTPVEKLSVTVETTPFLITQMSVAAVDTAEQTIQFTTSYGDTVTLDESHPLTLDKALLAGQDVPVVEVRYGMKGRLTRSVFEELVELGEYVTGESDYLKLVSSGVVIELLC